MNLVQFLWIAKIIPIIISVNSSASNIQSFANSISQYRDLIMQFFSVKTISFVILPPSELTNWNIVILEALNNFHLNYTYTVFREPLAPGENEIKTFAALENEGFVIGATASHPLEINYKSAALWRRNGYYLVLLADAQTEEEIVSWLRKMWSTGSVTVMTIFRGRVWTYQPFKQVNGSYGRIEMFPAEDDGKSNNANYKRQIIRDLHGYPLRLELFESGYNIPVTKVVNGVKSFQYFVGPDKETIDVLQREMNFTAVLQKPDSIDPYGSKLPNGTFTGCLGRIIYKESDLVVTGFFIKDYLSDDLEFSVGIYSDELCCVTKKALRIPQYLLPVICFEPNVWLILFLTTLLSGLVWIMLREVAIRNNPFEEARNQFRLKDYFQIVEDSVIIMLSSPVRRSPKRLAERAFVASICMVSLIFVAVFQSSLSTVFIKPVYYKDINTLQDLARSNSKIHIKYPAMMDDLFPPGSAGILGQLRDKMVLTNNTSSLMDKIAKEGKIVAVTRKELIPQSYSKFFASRQVHLIQECPRSYNLGFFGPKNSVFMERVNEVLLRMNNGGFHVKWIRDLNFNYTWITLKAYGNFDVDSFKVLTSRDLQLPYYILGMGCVLSVGVFLFEQFYYLIVQRWSFDLESLVIYYE